MKYTLQQYQVDAFAERAFEGNPAAVVPLDVWLPDALMQAIALENNLSETAFFVPEGDGYRLRWFTPGTEVDLCGHATLATAHVLYAHLGHSAPAITFHTRSGALHVSRSGAGYVMDFPAGRPRVVQAPGALIEGIGCVPLETWADGKYMAVLKDEAAVRAVTPDAAALMRLDLNGVIVTAPGEETDFVSRYFAPRVGVLEDPVTGSAHCMLAPWWANRLGRNELQARQVSARGGNVGCVVRGDRVELTGNAVTFMEATISFDDTSK